MHFFFFSAALIASSTAYSFEDSVLPQTNLHRRATCPSFKSTTIAVGEGSATLTGPFALTANGASSSDTFTGKYARSGPPDGSCCNNFFVYGISAEKANETATNFFLDKDGHLISIQNGVMLTAYENLDESLTKRQDEASSAHILLGTSDDIGGYPVMSCTLDEDTCALDCGVNDLGFSCLGSPGFQPDWRIASDQDSAGKGCAAFTPMAVAPVGDYQDIGTVIGSSSAASVSASSTAIGTKTKSSNNTIHTTTASKNPHVIGGGGGGVAGASASATSPISLNWAVQTVAPVMLANAAVVLGAFAAL